MPFVPEPSLRHTLSALRCLGCVHRNLAAWRGGETSWWVLKPERPVHRATVFSILNLTLRSSGERSRQWDGWLEKLPGRGTRENLGGGGLQRGAPSLKNGAERIGKIMVVSEGQGHAEAGDGRVDLERVACKPHGARAGASQGSALKRACGERGAGIAGYLWLPNRSPQGQAWGSHL